MAGDAVYVTKEHLQSMQSELHELKTRGRKEIAQKIADARSHGDLSENADYDAAKHEQELLEIRIARLEGALSRVQVIDPKDFPDDKVYILSKVRLMNRKTNKEIEYQLVSPEEAYFEQNKLSVTSPLGKALLGTVVGDVVETKVPAGVIQYEVLGIRK
jgi:transcription elongation factor GreA